MSYLRARCGIAALRGRARRDEKQGNDGKRERFSGTPVFLHGGKLISRMKVVRRSRSAMLELRIADRESSIVTRLTRCYIDPFRLLPAPTISSSESASIASSSLDVFPFETLLRAESLLPLLRVRDGFSSASSSPFSASKLMEISCESRRRTCWRKKLILRRSSMTLV